MHFSPGAFAWTTVDLPLGDVRADALARIQIEVGHTFVPSKLGLGSDSRALGVMIRQIELLADAVADRVDEQVGEQIGNGSGVADTVIASGRGPCAAQLGSTISLASPDAERMIRLAGFSGLEPDGRWTDGETATVAIRVGNHTGKGRLQTPFHTVCHVTHGAIDSCEVRRWAGARPFLLAGSSGQNRPRPSTKPDARRR